MTRWSWRRARQGRGASPSARVLDSQSVKTTESDSPRGFDAGKVKGRKRHIITDTDGHLVALSVHPTDILDYDGALGVIGRLRRLYPMAAPSVRRWRLCRRQAP